ncbi:protein of unknown function [Burkholderia multivorans]
MRRCRCEIHWVGSLTDFSHRERYRYARCPKPGCRHRKDQAGAQSCSAYKYSHRSKWRQAPGGTLTGVGLGTEVSLPSAADMTLISIKRAEAIRKFRFSSCLRMKGNGNDRCNGDSKVIMIGGPEVMRLIIIKSLCCEPSLGGDMLQRKVGFVAGYMIHSLLFVWRLSDICLV